MLRLRLLGEPSAEVDGHPAELPSAWNATALLAWLALHPSTHRRRDVAVHFWPDVTDAGEFDRLVLPVW